MTKLYRRGLLISGALRESIDKNIGHNLEGPQKVLAQALALGGHYSELGEDQNEGFSPIQALSIFYLYQDRILLVVSPCVRIWTIY